MGSVEGLLAEFDDDHGDIALELRDLVLEVLDHPEERVYTGWKGLGYHTEDGYICGIFLGESGVRLGFERGVEVPDPEEALHGEGGRVRYLAIPNWDHQTRTLAERFLRRAVELD